MVVLIAYCNFVTDSKQFFPISSLITLRYVESFWKCIVCKEWFLIEKVLTFFVLFYLKHSRSFKSCGNQINYYERKLCCAILHIFMHKQSWFELIWSSFDSYLNYIILFKTHSITIDIFLSINRYCRKPSSTFKKWNDFFCLICINNKNHDL